MKRFLAFVLVVCMALSLLPTAAFAAGITYYVNNESGDDLAAGTEAAPFKTLSKAVETATRGDHIVLTGNITLDASVAIPENISLTVPKGFTLTVPEAYTLTNNGIVNINGTYVTAAAYATSLVGAGEYIVAEDAEFMVDTTTTYIGAGGILTIESGALTLKTTPAGGMDMTVPNSATLAVNKPNQASGAHAGKYLNGVNDVITMKEDAILRIDGGVTFINTGVLNIDGDLRVMTGASLVGSNNQSGDQALVSRIAFGPEAVINIEGTAAGLSNSDSGKHFKWSPADPAAYDTSGEWKQVVAETYADEDCTSLTGYCFSLADGSAAETVKLIADVTLGSDLDLGSRRIVTDGHTLKLSGGMKLSGGVFTHMGGADSFAVIVEYGSAAALNNVTLSSSDAAPLVQNKGTLTISGGAFSSSRNGLSGTAIENRGGTLTIDGGLFNGIVNTLGGKTDTGYPDGYTTIENGVFLADVVCTYNQDDGARPQTYIKSGTGEGKGSYFMAQLLKKYVKIGSGEILPTKANDTGAIFSITGGYFTSDPYFHLADSCISKVSDNENFQYTVVKVTPPAPTSTDREQKANAELKPVTIAEPAKPDDPAAAAVHYAIWPTPLAQQTFQPTISVVGLESAIGDSVIEAITAVVDESNTSGTARNQFDKVNTPNTSFDMVATSKLDVKIEAVEPVGKTFTLDIEPSYTLRAFNKYYPNQPVLKYNGVEFRDATPDVNGPVTISFKLDSAYLANYAVIKNVKDDGTAYYYEAVVKDGFVTFTVTNGFCAFTYLGNDNTLTIKYDEGGGTKQYHISDLAAAPDLPTASKDGYYLTGWKINGKVYSGSFTEEMWNDLMPGGEIHNVQVDAEAQFAPIPLTAYRLLTFETNGGAAISAVRKAEGTTVALSGYVPVREGYKFIGWFSDQALTRAVDSVKLDADTKVYAKWLKENSMDNFSLGLTYNGFDDVDESLWYGTEQEGVIRDAVLLGVMAGYGNGKFGPDDALKISEAIKIACVVHSTYAGDGRAFTQGEPWYQVYIDYALEKGIIKAGDFADYTAVCTRAQAAYIFARSLPAAELPAKNTLTPPDLAPDAEFAAEINLLYAAGVLRGSDESGAFDGEKAFTRAQAAAIVTRLAIPANRF